MNLLNLMKHQKHYLSFLHNILSLLLLHHHYLLLPKHLYPCLEHNLKFEFQLESMNNVNIHLIRLQSLPCKTKMLLRPAPATIILEYKLAESFQLPLTNLKSVAPPPPPAASLSLLSHVPRPPPFQPPGTFCPAIAFVPCPPT